MKYAVEAPDYLKKFHEKEGQAKRLLGLLLSDSSMTIVWTRLGRQIKTDDEWFNFWMAIKTAISKANPKRKPKRVEEEADDLKWIATRAAELAKVIRIERRGVGYKGFFDFHCLQFCPDEVMKINGVSKWSSLDSMEQYAAASEVMKAWPTMAELLDGLSAHALDQAGKIETKRVVLKDRGRWSETMFSRQLYSFLSKYPWEKRDSVFANIAIIANMANETGFLKIKDNEGVTAKFVRSAIVKSD